MKPFLSTLFILCSSLFCNAQYYTFSHLSEPYVEFTDGTLMDFDSIVNYNNFPPLVEIGFDMPFFNTSFSSIGVDQSFLLTENLSDIPGEVILGQLFPFGAGYSYNLTSGESARFKTEGTAGSRIFKLQMKQLAIQNDSLGNDRCNFQVWMYEQNGQIEFRTGAYQISQNDGYFTGEAGILSGILLLDDVNFAILPGSIFLTDSANFPIPFLNATVDFVPHLIGHPTEGKIYRFNNINLGLNKLDNIATFEIYPNPSEKTITLTSVNQLGKTIIKDFTGKSVFEKTELSTVATINIESLSAGIYFVEVNSQVLKLVKK